MPVGAALARLTSDALDRVPARLRAAVLEFDAPVGDSAT
jgi:hypothetical protein